MSKKIDFALALAAQRTLRKLAETNAVANEPYGVIDFDYNLFMEASNGAFKYPSAVSTILTSLMDQKLVERTRRGSSKYLSRWNVADFISVDIVVEEEAQVVAALPAPQEVVEEPVFTIQPAPQATITEIESVSSEEQAVTIGEVRETVRGMAEFLVETQKDMISHLNNMVAKLTLTDPERLAQVENSLLETMIESDQLKAEIRRLQGEVESARNEAANKPEQRRINKHIVLRNQNQILDELERWINTPGWQKQSKAEYFRKAINTKLNEIMREVGVEEGV
jgi:hypothetical protein